MRAYYLSSEAIAREAARARAAGSDPDLSRVVQLGEFDPLPLGPRDVRMRVLAFAVERNVVHAALCTPVDIVARLGGFIRPGNTFVGEVVEVGAEVAAFAPGDVVTAGRNFSLDRLGLPTRAWGFDQPQPPGAYAEEVVLEERVLLRLPLESGLSLLELAAVGLKGPCAYHLWRRGRDLFRAKLGSEPAEPLNVLAFGGGVSESFLLLARSEGHRALYCAGNPARRSHMEALGVATLDRHRYEDFATPADVRRFAREARRWSGAAGVQIVCDMFRGRLFRAGLAVLARGGVNVSSGWQLGTDVGYDSALLSTNQVTLDHMHMATDADVQGFFGRVGPGLRPALHREIYRFEDFPRALEELRRGTPTGCSVVQVAEALPAPRR